MKNYQVVFWDFDGVWSKDKFYKSFPYSYPDVWEFIQTKIWGANRENRVDKWMKGELTMNDINKLISKETGLDFETVTNLFLDDVAQMEIETRHIPIVQALKRQGVKVGMITNNMDAFDIITRPRLKLDELFNEKVFNSFTHKKMKAEGLYDIAMQSLNQTDYTKALMIDDSSRARAAFEAKGGQTYPYTSFEDFQTWATTNFSL